MDALDRAIKKAGTVAELARLIGAKHASRVSNWKMRGQVPEDMCAAIEAATGVRCEELRPDVEWERDETGKVIGYRVLIPPPANDDGVPRAA